MALAKQNLRLVFRENEGLRASAATGPRSGHPDASVLDAARFRLRYPSLETELDAEAGILWATMRHPERASFTAGLMADARDLQGRLRGMFRGPGRAAPPFRYLAWRSAARGAWSLGGDLAAFTRLIRARDHAGLQAYAQDAIDVLHENYRAYDLPVMTAALVQGDAIGGGLEAMLTNDLVVAERGARFGLPEVLFGMFPGMGGFSLLRRRVGDRMARTLIEDGRTRSADELHELGLVDILCERDEGEAAMLRHAREQGGRFDLALTLARVRRRADPVTREELMDVVDLWVDLAMGLGEPELRRMDALARHQERMRARG